MEISKKGSMLVEASMVFPIIIISSALLISYSQKGFELVKSQAEEHNLNRIETMKDGVVNMGECDFVRRIDLLIEANQ